MSNDHIAKPLIVEISGDHYTFTPLRLSDIAGPVTDYLKMEPVAALLQQRDAFEPEVFSEMMAQVKEEVSLIELGTDAFSEMMFKPKNVVYTFWLSLRKEHPHIKKVLFDEMLHENLDVLKILYENYDRLVAITSSEPVNEDSPTRKDAEGAKKKTSPST